MNAVLSSVKSMLRRFFETPAEKESGKILPDRKDGIAEGFLRGRRKEPQPPLNEQ